MSSTFTMVGLREMSTRLDRAAALARAAVACAEAGAEDDAVRMTLELDLDVLLSEAGTWHAALSLLKRKAIAEASEAS